MRSRALNRASVNLRGSTQMQDENRQPLVSTVIPTYQRANLVARAIRSVLSQTVQDLEVIVVDDASTDDTKAAVAAVGDTRVRYLRHEKNKGLPASRNTGIQAARGEYIAFLDDDDEWREDKLEKQLLVIKSYDAVLSGSLWNGRPRRIHNRPTVSLDDLRRGSFASPTLLARASVLRDVLFDESLRQGEDWDAFIRIAQKYSIGYVAESLVFCNAGAHPRITNEAKDQTGPELEKRTAVLYKHREFFGEKWFMYHLASNFLTYIGSRPNKLHCTTYAIRRCGVRPVAAVLFTKARRWLQSRLWTGSD